MVKVEDLKVLLPLYIKFINSITSNIKIMIDYIFSIYLNKKYINSGSKMNHYIKIIWIKTNNSISFSFNKID